MITFLAGLNIAMGIGFIVLVILIIRTLKKFDKRGKTLKDAVELLKRVDTTSGIIPTQILYADIDDWLKSQKGGES